MSWLFAWSLIIPFSCFPKHLPGKNIFFKTREFYSNSRPIVAFYIITKNPRKFTIFFNRISVVCLCKLLNICLYFRKYWVTILIFMVFLYFHLIPNKTVHIHLFIKFISYVLSGILLYVYVRYNIF